MTTNDLRPPPLLQPPLLQPPRHSFSCDRHPQDNYTGFCPSCLCERLTILDQTPTASSSKAIFRQANRNKLTTATKGTSSLLQLRRTKSFSASKNEGLGFFTGVFEPQRKSCDVRGRNTLWSLFSIDDENKPEHNCRQQQTKGSSGTVLETNEEAYEEGQVHNDEDGYGIRVSNEGEERKLSDLENDIVEMEAEIDAIVNNLKSMKDHIDLDSHSKKPSSNFWSAASVLSKKWHKWRGKQKKSLGSVVSSRKLPVEKPISRQCRETASEVADYGFGRTSCDIEPRFSMDVGGYSLDEPRASWDGYLIGRSFPRLLPMVKDVPGVQVPRSDMQLPTEDAEEKIPGGWSQTREYYLKRRKNLDRSKSMDERKANTLDYRPRFGSIGGEKELERDETYKKSGWWRWKLWGSVNGEGGNGGFNRSSSSSSSLRWKKSNSFVLERNGSGRYMNGVVGFYLTPVQGSRRSNSHSIARNMLGST